MNSFKVTHFHFEPHAESTWRLYSQALEKEFQALEMIAVPANEYSPQLVGKNADEIEGVLEVEMANVRVLNTWEQREFGFVILGDVKRNSISSSVKIVGQVDSQFLGQLDFKLHSVIDFKVENENRCIVKPGDFVEVTGSLKFTAAERLGTDKWPLYY